MSKRTDLLYFGRMMDEARAIDRCISGVTEAEFTSDDTFVVAVGHRLETITRMAEKVSPDGKSLHPEIAWSEIADLPGKIKRNRYDFDGGWTWEAANIHVPPLRAALSRFVPSEPPENGTTMAVHELAISVPHEKVAEFCRKWNIKRLAFFGSVIRSDFDPRRSDVDVLVEFDEDSDPGWEVYGTIPNELAQVLGVREVDLVEFDSLNRWIRNDVLAEAVDEYVAA